jgi:osmotically-inducible protein OsmY
MRMKTDAEVRRNVEAELDWEPSVDAGHIAVAVKDGIVTLTGEVKSYAERWNAERAVERVAGVRGIVNEIQVLAPNAQTDVDFAETVAQALKSNALVPDDDITFRVDKGWVTLKGAVRYEFQRRAAERAVRYLPGVKGVVNLIEVKPGVEPQNVKKQIEDTLKRQAIIDAQNIDVETSDGEVVLTGTVRSWIERHEAEKAAWAAPGVKAVRNDITVKAVA